MILDESKCGDDECPFKTDCTRYLDKHGVNAIWRFTESPRKGDSCDMFWDRNQQNIQDKLESIVKGEEK